MEKRNLHKDKMKGFGSSGVSVMTGKNNGVSKRMKDDSPFLVSIHCMAHRLALCTSQVANGIPYLAKFKEILAALQGLSQAAPLHQSCTAIEIVWLCFSLPSIILMDLLGKQKFTLMGSKGYGLWFVICDWWLVISIYFVSFCVSRFVACDCNYDWQRWKKQLWGWLLNFRVRMFVKSTVKIARCIHHACLSMRHIWSVERDWNVTLEWTLNVR